MSLFVVITIVISCLSYHVARAIVDDCNAPMVGVNPGTMDELAAGRQQALADRSK